MSRFLFDSKHECFTIANFKYPYSIVLIHSNDRTFSLGALKFKKRIKDSVSMKQAHTSAIFSVGKIRLDWRFCFHRCRCPQRVLCLEKVIVFGSRWCACWSWNGRKPNNYRAVSLGWNVSSRVLFRQRCNAAHFLPILLLFPILDFFHAGFSRSSAFCSPLILEVRRSGIFHLLFCFGDKRSAVWGNAEWKKMTVVFTNVSGIPNPSINYLSTGSVVMLYRVVSTPFASEKGLSSLRLRQYMISTPSWNFLLAFCHPK